MTAVPATPPMHLILQGDAFMRGRHYGEQARDRIHRSLTNYEAMFASVGIAWAQAVARARVFEDVIGRVFPGQLDELRGIAQGSGTDMGALMALNCRTELLPANYLAIASGLLPPTLADGGHANECTSLAVSDQSDVRLLAQNWDWLGSQREALVLLEQHPDQGVSHITVAEAGMLAKIGLNDRGLGITLNILRSHEDDYRKPGMPVHALLRGLLDCEDVREARELALSLIYCSSSNVMMADADGAIVSIEASPRGARAVEAQADGARRWLCHTNHFCDPDLRSIDASLEGNLSTTQRLLRAQARIGQVHDRETAGSLLCDQSDDLQSICRFPDPSMPPAARIETVVSVVMDLAARTLWLSPAQPSITGYRAWPLEARVMLGD